jgi:hypothetical protein
MLKIDRIAFEKLLSGDPLSVRDAIAELNSRPNGHFEDHLPSIKFVRENRSKLNQLWAANPVEGCRDWVIQLLADTQLIDKDSKPFVIEALKNRSCSFVPTLLYAMSLNPDLFTDTDKQLLELASHPDREVRWRVAYLLSKLRCPTELMYAAIDRLRTDGDDTTRVYVNEFDKRNYTTGNTTNKPMNPSGGSGVS